MSALHFLRHGWTRSAQPAAPTAQRHDAPAERDDSSSFASAPPTDAGVAYRPVNELLAGHVDLIARIKLAYGADTTSFERDLLSLIRRFAAYVHLLPATAAGYFSAPGGLLRQGLETAFFSLQATDGQIFSGRETISRRRQLEPRWRQACFIAGLCHELHRTVGQLSVADHNGDAWPAFLMPLDAWLASRRRERFFVTWNALPSDSRSLAVYALPHIVPADVLQHLAAGNAVIVPQLIASLSGASSFRDNPIAILVRRCAALVIDREQRSDAKRRGSASPPAYPAHDLVEVMRRLAITDAAWQANAERSRVWFSAEGLFLIWPGGAHDLLKALDAEPQREDELSPDRLLNSLIASGAVEPYRATQPTLQIQPPQAKSPVEAIRLSCPSILYPGIEAFPAPIAASLLAAQSAPNPSSTRADAAAVEEAGAIKTVTTGPPDDDGQLSIPLMVAPVIGTDPRPALRLRAPPRLSLPVARALRDIVAAVDGTGDGAAIRVARGLFVPLQEIERRGMDPGTVVRALAELRILAPGRDGAKTSIQDIGGVACKGVVISPEFIVGLDPGDFERTAPAGA